MPPPPKQSQYPTAHIYAAMHTCVYSCMRKSMPTHARAHAACTHAEREGEGGEERERACARTHASKDAPTHQDQTRGLSQHVWGSGAYRGLQVTRDFFQNKGPTVKQRGKTLGNPDVFELQHAIAGVGPLVVDHPSGANVLLERCEQHDQTSLREKQSVSIRHGVCGLRISHV